MRIREWWTYWRYRNVTRRLLILKTRWRGRRASASTVGAQFKARGTAAHSSTSSRTTMRPILFVVAAAAILSLLNIARHVGPGIDMVDALLLAFLVYGYLRYSHI